jgi:hypothetical protein
VKHEGESIMRSKFLALVIPAAAILVACGGSDSSLFGPGSQQPDGPLGPNNPNVPNLGGIGGPHPTASACVSSTANAQLTPVDMVVMYDKSGSMGDPAEGFDPSVKWTPVNAAMIAFFSDPNSIGLAASLNFFPQGGDLNSVCAYDYTTPKVALTSLTTPQPIVDMLNATKPNGGTPTLPALNGAIAYAKQVQAQRPSDKTVVVLVTDGDPGFGINGQYAAGCANHAIAHVAATAQAAAQASSPILTYVIGVGLDVQNLDAIATGGGTGKAIMVPVSDPTQTKTAFENALNAIRTQAMSCDFALPPPPDGKQLDTNAVNVIYTNGSGTETVLTYSADCSTGAGWHYDNPSAPTKVQLCASTCNTVEADRAGKLTIAFGCKTVVNPR